MSDTQTSSPIAIQELSGLKPSNLQGALYCLLASAMTLTGVWLSLSDGYFVWGAGQFILAISFLQWFILLHEAGHRTLFRTRRLNTLAGHMAGLFSGFPYTPWTLVHFRHHKWTGWQDLDATTASLVPRPLKKWLPLFSLIYRINNYWNYPRVAGYLRHKSQKVSALRDIIVLLLAYIALVYVMGPSAFLHVFGLAFLLTLVMQEVILLSQHTHIPTNISHGESVRPFPPLEQEAYTRSLRFPGWISRMILMHFDAHELHHMYVNVPGYYLRKIPYKTHNEVDWWEWTRESRRLPGVSFLFKDRTQTGFSL